MKLTTCPDCGASPESRCECDFAGLRVQRRIAELGEQLESDRTKVADAVTAIRRAIDSRYWLAESRGSYEWDDDRYRDEFGAAVSEIRNALEPLAKIAYDWSGCPRKAEEIAQARVDLKSRIAELEQERDGATNAIKTIAAQVQVVVNVLAGERDEALRVRDLAREASNRDLEAKRAAEAQLAHLRTLISLASDAGICFIHSGLGTGWTAENERATTTESVNAALREEIARLSSQYSALSREAVELRKALEASMRVASAMRDAANYLGEERDVRNISESQAAEEPKP